ncbi:two pore domain potassium channel family protein [Burkholderia glumae]|uniref:potassium channel family protein n=1 Tax=Burkholderia glumae TaxID=337 RepID=UPI0021644C0E|nr:potassium channel family protein [Burkholderia glumae]UVS85676.1 two pore domain potassium channel family protein [Burkholderia glumae]
MPLNETDQSKLSTQDSELQALLRPYTAKPKVALSTTLGRAMDGLTYPQLFLIMFAVVLAGALYFYFATPCGQGVIYNTSDKKFNFGASIYFSVVTFTSLGYGDFSPVGFGRVIASFEVLIGITSVAVFVGKLASERQSTALLLLFTSDNQRRLSEFRRDADSHRERIELSLNNHKIEDVEAQIRSALAFIPSVRNYLAFQSHQGRLASFGNRTALRQLYGALLRLQLTASNTITYSAINPDLRESMVKLVREITRIPELMLKFHKDDFKSKGMFLEIGRCCARTIRWYEMQRRGTATFKHVANITDELLDCVLAKLNSAMWHHGLSKSIAKELGITHKLVIKCLDQLVDAGKFDIPGSTRAIAKQQESMRRAALEYKKQRLAKRTARSKRRERRIATLSVGATRKAENFKQLD